MSNKPTRNAIVGQFKNNSGLDDFIQFYDPSGTITAWIDAEGFLKPNGSADLIPSTTLYVDNTRVDSYTPDGTIQYPFKSIMAAVNQVITNGDNSASKPYAIDIVGPGTYNETVDLSNPNLVNLSMDGHNNVFIGFLTNPTGAALQAINNSSLGITVSNIAFNINSIVYKVIEFITGAASFINCTINGGGTDGIHFQNAAGAFHRCQVGTPTNITLDNTNDVAFYFCSYSSGGTLTLKNGGDLNVAFSKVNPTTISIDATSTLFSSPGGQIGTLGGTITVDGNFTSHDSQILSDVTVNNGGTLATESTRTEGSVTVISGGAYTQSGIYVGSGIILNGTNISVGTGSPESAVVGNPGDLYLNQSGGSGTTLYVKESGTATNTGWVGK